MLFCARAGGPREKPEAAPSCWVGCARAGGVAWGAPFCREVEEIASVEGITEYALAERPARAHAARRLQADDDREPDVSVGSRMENYGETGMAHLLEHLMFKGTPTTFPIRRTKSPGAGCAGTARLPSIAPTTSRAFSQNDADLDFYLRWLGEALTQSFIARKDLDSEMTVVRNEMESGENDPGNVLFQNCSRRRSTGTTTPTARSARAPTSRTSTSRLQAFYRKYYQPDNAVLIVAGKFDEAKTLAIIAATFGKIAKPTRVIEPTYTLDPTQDGERTVTLRRVGDTPILLRYHVPAGSSPDFAAVTLAGLMLGGPEFRLHKALVEKDLAAGAFGGARAWPSPATPTSGAAEERPAARAGARRFAGDGRGHRPHAVHRGRARSRQEHLAARLHADVERPAARRPGPVGIRRARRLAPRLRPARPHQGGDAGRRQPRCGLFHHQRSHPRQLHSERGAGARAGAGTGRRRARDEGLQGRRRGRRRRGFDASPENIDKRTTIATLPARRRFAWPLPKATRGGKVVALIALHLGDEKSLFGKELGGCRGRALLSRGTERLSREQLAAAFEKLQTSWSVGGARQGVGSARDDRGEPAAVARPRRRGAAHAALRRRPNSSR